MANDVGKIVSGIIADVKKRGDVALFEFTAKFDGWKPTAKTLKVSAAEIKAAEKSISSEVKDALKTAIKRVEKYHKKQLPKDVVYDDGEGFTLGWKWNAVGSVALYVPGGTAVYPSSVVMNAIPAKVAGVERIAILTPAKNGKVNDAILVAAKLCGITEIYKVGGAQAVAAAAHGTASIKKFDKIVGPGNAFVAEAKRQVFGIIGIDTIAGPTDVTIIADDTANPGWVAADLLAQAEHDVMAKSVLVTNSKTLAASVKKEVESQLKKLPRKDIAGKSWKNNGKIIMVSDIMKAADIANDIAPEHLEIITKNPEKIAAKIKNAGAIFIGGYSVEAIGDYIAGPSHVLPTDGAARFSSGLSVYDFIKKSSIIKASEKGMKQVAKKAIALAKAEGLDAHANSMLVRLKK